MLCVCIFSGQFALPTSVKGWMLVIFFAFVLNVVAMVLFQKGTFVVGGSRASILSTFDPITSVVAGVIVFNEGLSVFTVVGTILVVGASILTAVSDMRAIRASE